MTNQSLCFYDDKTEVKKGDHIWTYGYAGKEKSFGTIEKILLSDTAESYEWTGGFDGGIMIEFEDIGFVLVHNLNEIFFINRKEKSE